MIPSTVLFAAVALQDKVPLSSKFSRNPWSMPKTYTHMFCRPRKSIWPGSSWKALGCCGSTVLPGASCWPSSSYIPIQKIVSLSTELTHNRSTLVLDSYSGLRCHHSSSYSISGFSTLRPAGQIRPAKPFHPAAKRILPIIKNIFTKSVLIW